MASNTQLSIKLSPHTQTPPGEALRAAAGKAKPWLPPAPRLPRKPQQEPTEPFSLPEEVQPPSVGKTTELHPEH